MYATQQRKVGAPRFPGNAGVACVRAAATWDISPHGKLAPSGTAPAACLPRRPALRRATCRDMPSAIDDMVARTRFGVTRRRALPTDAARRIRGADAEADADRQARVALDAPDRLADTALMDALRAMVLRADADIHERQIRALIGRPDAGAYMGTIACPVLLVAARQDAWSPVVQHEEIAAAVPDAELAVIEDAGHFAPLERPDAVSAAIVDWLERKIGLSSS